MSEFGLGWFAGLRLGLGMEESAGLVVEEDREADLLAGWVGMEMGF